MTTISKDTKRAEAKVRNKISEEAILNLLEHVQFIGTAAEMIKIEHMSRLVDHRFKNPVLNNHAKKIKESAAMIQTHLSSLTYNKDREFFEYDYAVQLHRVLKHFIGLSVQQVEEFMDSVEKLQAENEAKKQLEAS